MRERTAAPGQGVNTCLKVVRPNEKSPFAISRLLEHCSLAVTPLLHFNYCFDPGERWNLYFRRQWYWYEITLTGENTTDSMVQHIGEYPLIVDGRWHHAAIDIGAVFAAMKKPEAAPSAGELTIEELKFATGGGSASTPSEYWYGTRMHDRAIRLDNIVLLPKVAETVTLSWTPPSAKTWSWKTAVDASPWSTPETEAAPATTATLHLQQAASYFHFTGDDLRRGSRRGCPYPPLLGARSS